MFILEFSLVIQLLSLKTFDGNILLLSWIMFTVISLSFFVTKLLRVLTEVYKTFVEVCSCPTIEISFYAMF